MNSTMLYQDHSRAFHNLSTDFSMMNIHQPNFNCGPRQQFTNGFDDNNAFNQQNGQYWHEQYPTPVNTAPQSIDPLYESRQSNNGRRSSNMTETVPVPSSEHVAEIVGRQGCKIKTLRAKTNTYIKTPVRGAEPAFVITGRREDVEKAKQEILSAAAHFSQLRSSRHNGGKIPGVSTSPPSTDSDVKVVVRVPYKFVGLVIGPKGISIKRIQQMTSTHISTPGLNQDPIFEITGQPQNVEKAKVEIENHIVSRTGPDNHSDLQIDNFHVDSGFDQSNESPRTEPSLNGFHHVINLNDNLPPLSTVSQANSLPSDQLVTAPNPASIFNNKSGESFSRPFDSFIPEQGLSRGVAEYFTPSSIWADRSSYLTERIAVQECESSSLTNLNVESDPIIAALSCFSQSTNSSCSGSSSPGANIIPGN